MTEFFDELSYLKEKGGPLINAWFADRMMTDVWFFGLLLKDGTKLAIDSVHKITRDAAGDIWIDVRMIQQEDLKDTRFSGYRGSPTRERTLASIRADAIILAWEIADT